MSKRSMQDNLGAGGAMTIETNVRLGFLSRNEVEARHSCAAWWAVEWLLVARAQQPERGPQPSNIRQRAHSASTAVADDAVGSPKKWVRISEQDFTGRIRISGTFHERDHRLAKRLRAREASI